METVSHESLDSSARLAVPYVPSGVLAHSADVHVLPGDFIAEHDEGHDHGLWLPARRSVHLPVIGVRTQVSAGCNWSQRRRTSEMTPHYRQIVRKMDENTAPDSVEGHAVALLFAGARHGTRNVRELAAITGVPYESARTLARRLRSNGVWVGGKTRCNWDDPQNGGIAFWMDVCVATGMLNRVRSGSTVEAPHS